MNDPRHIDADDAALYALNALDEPAQRAVDRHARDCAVCNRLLGKAESDVSRLAAVQPQHRPPADLFAPMPRRQATTRWVWTSAVAAAVALAILPSAYFWQQNAAMRRTAQTDAAAIGRIAETSHRTAPFRGMNAGTSASVMYAPDGSWYVVLVRGATRALDVVWMHDGRATMLGAAEPHGDVAMLYLPKSHRMDRLALVDGGRVVAEAQLAY